MSPEEFRRHVKKAYQQIGAFIKDRGNERLQKLWPEWESRLKWLHEQSKSRPEVAISMVGGTGAGKSTLLNALIGARVLPVSNMRACTAAISEVSYAEGPYSAQIDFVTRESWQKEIDILLEDLNDAVHVDGSEANDPRHAISKAALDRLWTVYRNDADEDRSSFDPFNLREPEAVTRVLDSGVAKLENSDLKKFRKAVSRYLDSKHRYWPIVQRVSIQGPFEALQDGAKLIDLPGVNDPNEARETVTRNHLKTCRFVWIVFNIKRALTKDTMNLMQTDDFLRQVVMDGRADALTFVGTASDDIDIETGIEEFDLDEDAEIIEIVSARNTAVRQVVLDQLDELAERLARLASETPETAHKLAGKLKNSQVLTVSAREYLRLKGLARTNAAGLNDTEVTEIPALQQHMRQICANYGVEAHIGSLKRQLDLLTKEIKREIQSQRAVLRNQAEVSEKQRKEMGVAVEAAQKFLDRDLEDVAERLAQDLESSQSLLAERIRRAVDRARADLEESTLRRWARSHHGTIRAVCRRGGVYVGSTGRNDFPADLCKPILDGIAFAWSDFFGEKLRQILEKWTDRLRRKADDYRRKLFESLDTTSLPTPVYESMSGIFDTTEQVLDEILAQISHEMDGRITEKQRTLYEQVPEQVKANMQEAFESAAEEAGAGMKQRMIDTLSEKAREVSQTMFDDARDALLNGVRSLNNWLESEYGKMVDAVKRNASLAAENVVSGEGQLTEDKIAQRQSALDGFEAIINSLGQTSSAK